MTSEEADTKGVKQGTATVVKWGSGFESGWYMPPGTIDPELEKIEQNEEEDKLALPSDEFYDLLHRLWDNDLLLKLREKGEVDVPPEDVESPRASS